MADDFVKIDTSGRKTQAPIVAVDIADPVAELVGDGINPTVYTIENIVLLASNWILVNGVYEYIYTNAFINTRSVVSVITHIESVNIVRDAKLLNAGNSYAGYMKLYAYNLPAGNIIVTLHIAGEGYQGAIPNLADLPERNYESLNNLPVLFQLPTQTGNAGKVLGTDGTAANWVEQSGGGNLKTFVQIGNSLNIDCLLGDYYIAELTGTGASFAFTNMVVGKEITIRIRCTNSNGCTVLLPNTADIYVTRSFRCTYSYSGNNYYREISMIWDATYRNWQIGVEGRLNGY